MNSILPSLAVSGLACLVLLALFIARWRKIIECYGAGGIIVYAALVAFFPLQCFLWTLSLCPPLNDPDDPLILGTGGAVYGLNYGDYLSVTLLLISIPLISMSWLLLQTYRKTAKRPRTDEVMVKRLSTSLAMFALPLFALSAIFLFEFFRREGLARFWSSPLDRFEGALWETGVEGGSQSGSLFMRIYLGYLYLSSFVAAIGLALRTRKFINLGTLFINLPPFLVWESRGMSVVATAAVLGWLFSLRTARVRKLAVLPAFCLIILIYQVPLGLRELPGTGVAKFGAVIKMAGESEDFGPRSCTVRTMQNLAQSFPNFSYYFEEYAQGMNEMDQVPERYKLLALSPTVSMIDGWANDCMDLQLRINYYTPISAWPELFLISPILPFIVLTFFSGATLLLIGKAAEYPSGRLMFSPVLGLLYTVALIMASQYYARTFSRYMWMTLFLGVGFLAFNRIASMRLGSQRAGAVKLAEAHANPR